MSKATCRISLKTIAFLFPSGSLERVYLHGKWQIERGRNPSIGYGNHPTPRQAFVTVDAVLGSYFDEIRHQEYSRQGFFWTEKMVLGIQNRVSVHKLPLPCPYRKI
jgi:hypothetical protein